MVVVFIFNLLKMVKLMLQIGIVLLLLAVVLGAFGAHSLEAKLNVEQLETFETGVRYQFYHGIAILLAILLHFHYSQQLLIRAAQFFFVGIILFSGSIYLLACREILGIASWTWLGPITPIGGTFFIVGWILLLLGVSKAERIKTS